MRALVAKLAAMFVISVVAVPLASQTAVDRSPLHAMGWGRESFLLSEVLEFAPSARARPLAFDLVGWSGGSTHRLWLKADGAVATVGRATHGEYQALYGRLISPFWDAQVGVRADVRSTSTGSALRVGALVGLQGLAPNWFELEPSVFLTTDGNVSLDLTGSYDLFLTQRLILQPRLETTVSLRDETAFGLGRGLSNASFALRTRYEVRREFAPYMGVLWERGFGRTAELARIAGDPTGEVQVVVGLRLWR